MSEEMRPVPHAVAMGALASVFPNAFAAARRHAEEQNALMRLMAVTPPWAIEGVMAEADRRAALTGRDGQPMGRLAGLESVMADLAWGRWRP